MTSTTVTTNGRLTLRVRIDGVWDSRDFETFYRLVTRLYVIALDPYPWLEPPGQVPYPNNHPRVVALDRNRLRVRRIHYGSEGFSDFTGIGRVIEALKDLILGLSELGPKREREKARAQGQRIENARNAIKLIEEARAAGLSPQQVDVISREVLKIERQLRPFAENNQITGADVLDEDQ